eukprot:gene9310-10916_t
MGILERKLRHKESIRIGILEAAWQLVITDGWQSLSIRKIADAIEYSIPVIYNHFENKEAILLEFTKEGFEKLAETLGEVKKQYNEPAQQLVAMGDAYWDFAFENREYYQLMFGLGIPACDTVKRVPELKEMTCLMISTIKEALAMGKNPEADYFLKYHTYWSILHGLVSIQMIECPGNEQPDITKKMIVGDAMAGFVKSLVD